MTRAARAIATVCGLGRLRVAPGTAGSLVGLLIALICRLRVPPHSAWLAFLALCAVGTWAAGATERADHVHDPGYVVVDEVIGVWLALLLIPGPSPAWWVCVLAFALFRFFDIRKPPPLK